MTSASRRWRHHFPRAAAGQLWWRWAARRQWRWRWRQRWWWRCDSDGGGGGYGDDGGDGDGRWPMTMAMAVAEAGLSCGVDVERYVTVSLVYRNAESWWSQEHSLYNSGLIRAAPLLGGRIIGLILLKTTSPIALHLGIGPTHMNYAPNCSKFIAECMPMCVSNNLAGFCNLHELHAISMCQTLLSV